MFREEDQDESEADKEERMFGLLKFRQGRRLLDYKVFRSSDDPEKTSLILVYFSDRILNLKAEQIGMMVHI